MLSERSTIWASSPCHINMINVRIHSLVGTQIKWMKTECKSDTSPAGNRTPVSRVTGGDTYHYTTEDVSSWGRVVNYFHKIALGFWLKVWWNLWLLFSFVEQEWRIRVSIPVPFACEANALPFELTPLDCVQELEFKHLNRKIASNHSRFIALFSSSSVSSFLHSNVIQSLQSQ